MWCQEDAPTTSTTLPSTNEHWGFFGTMERGGAEPHHGAAFYDLLDRVLPDWERRKRRLERATA